MAPLDPPVSRSLVLIPTSGQMVDLTMSPLYPCGKPCSRGTHNETVQNLALFCSIINGIMMESRPGTHIRGGVGGETPPQYFQSRSKIFSINEKSVHDDAWIYLG